MRDETERSDHFDWAYEDDRPGPLRSVSEWPDAGAREVVGTVEQDPEPEPTRWYEARLEVLIHEHRPSDTFGEGGDKIAHVRAIDEGASFADVAERLGVALGDRWGTVIQMAPIADQDWTPPPVVHEAEVDPEWWEWDDEEPSKPMAALAASAIFAIIALVVFGLAILLT